MNLVTVKTAAEVALKGVKAEYVFEDKQLRGVRLTDVAGRSVIIKAADTYSNAVRVLENNPYNEEERYSVEAVVGGELITRYFTTDYDAQEHSRALDRELSSDNRTKVTKVKVMVDEGGNVVKRSEAPAAADLDIPF